jgi:predicted CXXCH cytochrome family protein
MPGVVFLRQRGWSVVVRAISIMSLAGSTFAQGQTRAQGSQACAGCHGEIWKTYRLTGMARSFSSQPLENVPASSAQTYYHQLSNTYFSMLRRGDESFQRAYQLDAAGKQVNVTEKRIDYVMGSGNNARTYLHRTPANTLIELPLGWYAEKGGYLAMNPGYDRADHDGFRRPITYDCMFCHNAYPGIPPGNREPFAEPVYSGPLPEGIDCQRCHGSGTRHIQLAGTAGARSAEIRAAIVNPARLSPERQLEGCMVCHLESTSFPLPNALQRFERAAFSYQPGEPLGNFLLNFDHAPEAKRDDKFEIVNSAYRMRRSACFLKSGGKLLCTTCHNPHDIPRGEEADRHYTEVCRQCHARAFESLVQAGKHTAAVGCVACHMPKRRTEDVIHVAATDHLIQRRPPPGDLLAERVERQDSYKGRVVLYYPEKLPPTPESELTLAVAQVIQQSNLIEGIARLDAAIRKFKPTRGEYYLELAEALQNNGQPDQALPLYGEAARRSPKSAYAAQKLGTALRKAGKVQEAADVLRRASVLEPARAVTWHELGLAYQATSRPADAIAAIGEALSLDPELPEAHNNLGVLRLASGDRPGAESDFREAIRARPAYADAHGNLAGLLLAMGRLEDAATEFETALRLRPTDGGIRYNYATLLGRTGRYDEAQRQLEEALRADPSLSDAHLLLADLLMARQQPRDAAPHYREVLRTAPESPRANLGLGAALLGTGDRDGAVACFRKAAAGGDPDARDQAKDILRQLGQPQ